MARKKFEFSNMPSLRNLEEKTALVLLNYDSAIDVPEPILPNVIHVGGLQIKEPKKLPKDLETFIESGKKGSVLMSLGTNVKSAMLGNETLLEILSAFKEIPEFNFIWKFEADELPIEKPKNVKIGKLLPQNDILANAHIKAFITHAGLMSSQESLWYGKPMVGVPFFGDQRLVRILLKVAFKLVF
jgi:glucuronosyltransferase